MGQGALHKMRRVPKVIHGIICAISSDTNLNTLNSVTPSQTVGLLNPYCCTLSPLVQFDGEEHLNELNTFLFCASNNIENTKKEKNIIIKKEIEVRKERRT